MSTKGLLLISGEAAMKAGVTDHLWSVEEIAGLLDSK
jgi:hypothetical protein